MICIRSRARVAGRGRRFRQEMVRRIMMEGAAPGSRGPSVLRGDGPIAVSGPPTRSRRAAGEGGEGEEDLGEAFSLERCEPIV
jgi:hypothetical protein